LSEATARLNMSYASYILDTGSKPTTITNLSNSTLLGSATMPIDIGDYFVTYNTLAGSAPDQTVKIDLFLKKTDGTAGADIVKFATVNWPK
ncbi:MAG: hypothetical protein Q7I92_06230, partial [Humidesulfovibrio sp.]|nr:hypothetical protein [Humidesulfovibrio sp.]